jgi:hypothetical protein
MPTLYSTEPTRAAAAKICEELWVQSPITLHLGSLDLERERALQLPVVERDEWSR